MKKIFIFYLPLAILLYGCPNGRIVDFKTEIKECQLACALEIARINEFKTERDSCLTQAWFNYQDQLDRCAFEYQESFTDYLSCKILEDGIYEGAVDNCNRTYDYKVEELFTKISKCRSNCIDDVFKAVNTN